MRKLLICAMSAFLPLMCWSASASGKGSPEAGMNFDKPDFAFPRSVDRRAREVLAKSVPGEPEKAVKALIQIMISGTSVSESAFNDDMLLFDSVARLLPVPYSNVIQSLQAQAYEQCYRASAYTYDSRRLPLSQPWPKDVTAWSRDMFAIKILDLTGSSLSGTDKLASTSLSAIKGLLNHCDATDMRYMPSVYDLLAWRALDMLRVFASEKTVIPFTRDVAQLSTPQAKASLACDNIYARLGQINSANPYAKALVYNSQADYRGSDALKFLYDKYRSFSDEPASMMLLCAMNQYVGNARDINAGKDIFSLSEKDYYRLCKEAKERFPDSDYAPNIENILAGMSRTGVSIEPDATFLAGDSIKARIRIENIKSCKLLLVKVDADGKERYIQDRYVLKGKVMSAVPVSVTGEIPFSRTQTVVFPPMESGYYVIVPSASSVLKDAIGLSGRSLEMMRVGTLSAFTTTCMNGKNDGAVYVVDAAGQKPVGGVSVSQYGNSYGNRNKLVKKGTTDAGGMTPLADTSVRLDITGRGEKFSMDSYYYGYRSVHEEKGEVKVLTDLSLYHPGDSVGFAIVAYTNGASGFRPAGNCDFKAELYDVNGQIADSCELRTDNFGRAAATLRLPENGVLGMCGIRVGNTLLPEISAGEATIMVAEYKAPSFYVELDTIAPEYSPGDDIVIRGHVRTYSGMPVAGAEVSLTVEHITLWGRWFNSGPDATYGTTAACDADGRFSFSLPTANLQGTPFATGVFTLQATATSPAGESMESPKEMFSLGRCFNIMTSVPDRVEASAGKLRAEAEVVNAAGTPQKMTVDYDVTDMADGRSVARGSFESPLLELPLRGIASGRYRLNFRLQADTTVKAAVTTVVYRDNDRVPPYTTALWLPDAEYIASSGKTTVDVTVGNSYKGEAVFCEVASSAGIISRKWLYPDGRNIVVSVPAPDADGRMFVNFVTMHNFRTETRTVTVMPAESARKLEIEVVTFRDKITPGAGEKWTFRFRDNDAGSPGVIPALAVMTDKALNAIYDFNWYFSPTRRFANPLVFNSYSIPVPGWYFSRNMRTVRKSFVFQKPEIDTYGMRLFNAGRNVFIRGIRPMMSRATAAGADGVVEEEAMDNMMYAQSVPLAESKVVKKESADEVAVAEGNSSRDETFRPAEYPLAFFKPMLTTDADGVLDVMFTVPDFNTTWQFQLLGYDDAMRTASAKLYSVASKPVMVQTQTPRFLRTGDNVMLKATLFNNTDSPHELTGSIEVFNPMTDSILATFTAEPQLVGSNASVVVEMPFRTPDDEQTVGIRARVRAEGFSDGEQTLVGILPSSSPVFESTDFYLAPDQDSCTVRLPEFDSDASVSLQYCDNPVWYCVTALPDIANPNSSDLLTLLYAYYGNALAGNLTSRYPRIAEAIKIWQESSALQSPLRKDEALKTIALGNTIWVRNAQSETLRMSRLKELLDTVAVKKSLDDLTARIRDLQTESGGWQWLPEMEPSLYLTSSVLLYMGQLKQMGCLPQSGDMAQMTEKAINFADAEVLGEYERIIRHKLPFPTRFMLSYFYIRSFYSQPVGRALASLRNITMKKVAAQWREFDIYNAATAAMTLYRNGDRKTPGLILESLKQKASMQKEKGMWYDNEKSLFSSFNTLITTAQVLEAYSEIEPDAEAVDGLRQWLVRQRQAQDWGQTRNIAEVIYAILSSGSDWTETAAPADITLGTSRLRPDSVQMLTGEFTMILDPGLASGATLSVGKHGSHPAWGGVMAQYIRPMAEVKAASVPDLSIGKKIYVVRSTASGESVQETRRLKIGDRVRVTLTIDCGRDMEYVAVTDERPACFAPAGQVPHFEFQEGLGFYIEPRKAQTNIFIGFLPKGVHTISYDCFVQQSGEFACGIATAQSQYAPLLTGHSAGGILEVEP